MIHKLSWVTPVWKMGKDIMRFEGTEEAQKIQDYDHRNHYSRIQQHCLQGTYKGTGQIHPKNPVFSPFSKSTAQGVINQDDDHEHPECELYLGKQQLTESFVAKTPKQGGEERNPH